MRRLLPHLVPVLFAACGDDAVTSDAGPSCAETAEPHDEDSDGIFDACDNCPAVANPTQTDATEREATAFADGVGDACDPRPSASGDVLHAFYAFASDADASAWTGSGFSISGDAVHASGTATWTSARAAPGGGGVIVLAQIASLSVGAQGELSIAFDGDGVGVGTACTISAQAVTVREVAGATMSADLAKAIEPGEPFSVRAWRTTAYTPSGRAGFIACRVTRGDTTNETSMMFADDLVTGTHAIAARDVTVDATSLSVYTSPPPKNP